jgi:gag-polypeptide of LTR copia-type
MKALVSAQDAWNLVESDYNETNAADLVTMMANQMKVLKEPRTRDKTALYLFFQAVDESGFEKITGAIRSKETWNILEKSYKCAGRVKQVRLQTLCGELEVMKMKESGGVSEYIISSDGNGLGRAGFVSNPGSGPSFKTLGPSYSALISMSKIVGPTRPWCFTGLLACTRPVPSCCIIN